MLSLSEVDVDLKKKPVLATDNPVIWVLTKAFYYHEAQLLNDGLSAAIIRRLMG